MAVSRRLALAKSITADLRGREGRNLLAVGVYGSVARGEERRHSDIDLLVVVRRKSPRIHHEVRDRIVATILQQTVEDAKSEVTGSRLDLNAILGGWTSLKPLPVPFSAGAGAVLGNRMYVVGGNSPEANGRQVFSFEAGAVDEAREMAIWFTNAAAGALLDLHARVLKTGRRGIVEASRFGKIGAAVRRLRYEELSLAQMQDLSELIWTGLLDRAAAQGIQLPPLVRTARGSLDG